MSMIRIKKTGNGYFRLSRGQLILVLIIQQLLYELVLGLYFIIEFVHSPCYNS